MAGKRPLPTAIKELQGTLQPCRANKNEPQPTITAPMAPEWMPDAIKAVYNELALHFADLRIMSTADGKALELLADAYHEWKTARAFIYANGETYETETATGRIIRVYPQVNIAADAYKRLRAMLIEFGATPAARSKVEVIKTPHKTSLDELIRRRKERSM